MGETGTGLAVREQGTVSASPVVPGIEDFGREDMVIPRLRLVQAQSGFSNEAGKLFNNMTNVAKETITVAVIGVRKGRIRWPKEFKRDQEPLCASDDAITAREDMAGLEADGTPTRQCSRCVYSQWSESDAQRRIPPACAQTYTFLVVDTDDDLPALITFQRTSAGTARQLLTLVKSFGFRRIYVLGTEQQTNEYGKFYVLTVKTGETLVPDRLNHYVELAEQYRERTISVDTGDDLRANAAPAWQEEDEEVIELDQEGFRSKPPF